MSRPSKTPMCIYRHIYINGTETHTEAIKMGTNQANRTHPGAASGPWHREGIAGAPLVVTCSFSHFTALWGVRHCEMGAFSDKYARRYGPGDHETDRPTPPRHFRALRAAPSRMRAKFGNIPAFWHFTGAQYHQPHTQISLIKLTKCYENHPTADERTRGGPGTIPGRPVAMMGIRHAFTCPRRGMVEFITKTSLWSAQVFPAAGSP